MRSFLSLFLLSVLVTGCAHPVKPPVEDRPGTEVDEGDDATSSPETPENLTLQMGLIALEDNGENGPLVGCGDSLIFVTETVAGPLTAEAKVQKALEALFAIKDSTYGESGLYTALDAAELIVDSVHLEDDQLEVKLSGTLSSGGVCDDPRIVEQIKETAKNNVGLNSPLTVTVLINGVPVEQQLSGK